LTGIAATLQQADPGIKVCLVFKDGSEIGGAFRGVNGELVDLGDGKSRIELGQVKRVRLEFSPAPRTPRREPPRERAQR
jgi:hypothetical protein